MKDRLQDELTPQELLKYIKREYDALYAGFKSLQRQYKELKEQYKQLEIRCGKYEVRISELTKEITRTPIYKDLMKRYVQLKHDNRDLQNKIAQLYRHKDE